MTGCVAPATCAGDRRCALADAPSPMVPKRARAGRTRGRERCPPASGDVLPAREILLQIPADVAMVEAANSRKDCNFEDAGCRMRAKPGRPRPATGLRLDLRLHTGSGIFAAAQRRRRRNRPEVLMPELQTAAYGSWSSPITSDMIVASSIGLGEILLDGADVYWLESRPQEGGRSVLVRRTADGTVADATPPVPADGGPAFNARTRVHEYGGGAYLVHDGAIYFCNDADQRLYRKEKTPGRPRPPPGSRPTARTALCRRRDRRRARANDLGARGPHDRRARAGQHARRNPVRRFAAAANPAVGQRFLCRAAPQPGRPAARLARMGPSADAVGRLRIVGRRDRRRRLGRPQTPRCRRR